MSSLSQICFKMKLLYCSSGCPSVELSADGEETGIQDYIGNETPVQAMKDCSVVTATYELGDGMKGTVGIIGPKRMDYDKVISTLKNMRHALDDLYKKN